MVILNAPHHALNTNAQFERRIVLLFVDCNARSSQSVSFGPAKSVHVPCHSYVRPHRAMASIQHGRIWVVCMAYVLVHVIVDGQVCATSEHNLSGLFCCTIAPESMRMRKEKAKLNHSISWKSLVFISPLGFSHILYFIFIDMHVLKLAKKQFFFSNLVRFPLLPLVPNLSLSSSVSSLTIVH